MKVLNIFFLSIALCAAISSCKNKEPSNTSGTKDIVKSNSINEELVVKSAEFQHWRGGTEESGSGTEYYIELEVKPAKPICEATVWLIAVIPKPHPWVLGNL